jgi:hypothetical protein
MPIWGKKFSLGKVRTRWPSVSLERLIYKYIVLNFARSLALAPDSPRLADQNTDKTLLYDVNKLSARDCIAAKLVKGLPRESRH